MGTRVGLTFTRRRQGGATTETGSPTREAGQFASYLSCPVRSSPASSVRLTVPSGVTPTQGAAVIYFDPDLATASVSAFNTLLAWITDASNYIEADYRKSTTSFRVTRAALGVSTTLSVSSSFSAGEALAVYIGWTATTLYLGVNGGTIQSVADANIPAVLPSTMYIGGQAGGTQTFEVNLGAVARFSGPLSQAQWEQIAALRSSRPPCFGECSEELMVGLWYGAHSVDWTLGSGGAAVDFNAVDESVTVRQASGMGVAPVQHRVVETPLRDGAAYIDSRLQARRIALQLALTADTLTDFYALRRRLASALNPRDGLGLLMFGLGEQVYEIDAAVDSGLGFDNPAGPVLQVPSPIFVCPDPAWRTPVKASTEIDVPASGWSIPWSIPWTFAEAAATEEVANDGDVDAYPTFVVTAGAAGCEGIQLENVTTGKLFKLDGLSLSAGESVTVNMDDRTATKDDGTNVFGYLTEDSQMWPLVPGTNDVKASVDSGSASVVVTHYARLVGV